MVCLDIVRLPSILRSAFSTSKHQLRGDQSRFLTSGGYFRARKPYFWTSKIQMWSSKTRIWSSKPCIGTRKTHIRGVSGGGLRSARIMLDGVDTRKNKKLPSRFVAGTLPGTLLDRPWCKRIDHFTAHARWEVDVTLTKIARSF